MKPQFQEVRDGPRNSSANTKIKQEETADHALIISRTFIISLTSHPYYLRARDRLNSNLMLAP